MTIRQDVHLLEFFRIILIYWRHNRMGKRVLFIIFLLPLLSTLLGALITASGLDMVQLLAGLFPGLAFLVVIMLFLFLMSLITYVSKPYLFHNVSYEFTHWGVIRNGERTDFSKPWREFTAYRETKDFFLLYVGTSDYHFIQKRMLAGPAETEVFRDLLKEKIIPPQKRGSRL